ncbi:(2Fe-2S) ferredoxin domain-containing protein [Stakelama sp. CBK3Z-3]|uniref:(2Fe-2S) ferredoxin domain-containing protein n=1 Tax=Stakelama flava TaxID=2860338 RepID=A0ABS6XGZ7_9SPHN|nr:(2Fe-2S) ferredoxin domain-containing protein [Stakelama flava]MBW4329489.1 (2Fe-2S) ferredoxin domain-containing protein [Stakelama flava]
MKSHINANWTNAALVCAKCQKKVRGGFGADGKQKLSKALRKHLGVKKGRKGHVGIVETKCLGVCPKNAVTVVNASRMDQWLLVAPGANLDEVARSLGLAPER